MSGILGEASSSEQFSGGLWTPDHDTSRSYTAGRRGSSHNVRVPFLTFPRLPTQDSRILHHRSRRLDYRSWNTSLNQPNGPVRQTV